MKKLIATMLTIGMITSAVTPAYAVGFIEAPEEELLDSEDCLIPETNESFADYTVNTLGDEPEVLRASDEEQTGDDKLIVADDSEDKNDEHLVVSENEAVSDKADAEAEEADTEEETEKGGLLPMPSWFDKSGGGYSTFSGRAYSAYNNDGASERPASCLGPDTRLSAAEKEYVISRVNQIVSNTISDNMDDIEKYWRLAQWVKENTTIPEMDTDWYAEHRTASDTPHGSYGALKNGIAMPQGQTLLYSKLCHAAGLPCFEVIDDTQDRTDTSHVVNLLPNINGNAYIVDILNDRFLTSLNSFYKFRRTNAYTYEQRFPVSSYTGRNDFTTKIYYKQYTPGLWNIYKSQEKYQSDPITYSNLVCEGYWHDSMLTCSYTKEVTSNGNYSFAWAEDAYIEKGSGRDGTRVALYKDYLDENRTGDWTIDDFYANPKDRYPKITGAAVTGLKSSYEFYDDTKIAEYIEVIKGDIIVTLDGKQLVLDTDYKVKSLVLNTASSATITLAGINSYAGTKDISIRTTQPLPHKAVNASVYESDTVVNTEIAKGKNDTVYTIDVKDRTIAEVLSDGTIRGIKAGNTDATITKANIIYDLSITVKAIENNTKNIKIVMGGKITDAGIAKTPADGKNYKITLSDKNIASVTDKGVIQGKKAGNMSATIERQGRKDRLNITVINPGFNNKTFMMNTGDTLDHGFDAQGLAVTITSDKPAIASVDGTKVNALSKGMAKITATVQGKKYSASVKVYDPQITAKTDTLLTDGKTISLAVKNGNGKTEWSSSDTSVATVTNGRVKGFRKGTAIITAINNGRKMTKEIKVFNVPKFEYKVYPTNVGEPINVAITKDPEMVAEYSINNTKIASISRDGMLTPFGKGSVTVTAKAGGKAYKTSVKIFDPMINGKDTVKSGKTLMLSIKNGNGPTIWSVSDTSIATITDKGKLTGIRPGTVTVIAVNNGRTMKRNIIVE